jgi:quercetin dioxygenase-like cupin family protein
MKIQTVDWETMEWRPVRRGIERKAFTGEGSTVALHRLWPGHERLPHSHPHEQIVYILDGRVDFHIGEEVVQLGPGGLALVPPNVIHYVEVVGEKPALNLDVFTPARPDYVA